MNVLKAIFGGAREPAQVSMRDTLFGDRPVGQWTGNGTQGFPWRAFASAQAYLAQGSPEKAVKEWRSVLDHPGLEPRHYLQAWHFLRQEGYQPPPALARRCWAWL